MTTFHKQHLENRVLSFLSFQERGNLAIAGRKWMDAIWLQDKKAIELIKRLGLTSVIFITDKTGRRSEKWVQSLGTGGCKRAILLESGRALLLPNCDCDSIAEIAFRWSRVVYEEMAVSNFLTSLGILSSQPNKVAVSFSTSGYEGSIPAYTAFSFEALAKEKGIFIIDLKNYQSCTWKIGKDLFKNKTDRFVDSNWDFVVDHLLDDVAKVSVYNFQTSGDSLNLAIVKNPGGLASDYQIRYFGFDFSSKSEPLKTTLFKPSSDKAVINANSAHYLKLFIDHAVWLGCGEFSNDKNKTAKELFDRLI